MLSSASVASRNYSAPAVVWCECYTAVIPGSQVPRCGAAHSAREVCGAIGQASRRRDSSVAENSPDGLCETKSATGLFLLTTGAAAGSDMAAKTTSCSPHKDSPRARPTNAATAELNFVGGSGWRGGSGWWDPQCSSSALRHSSHETRAPDAWAASTGTGSVCDCDTCSPVHAAPSAARCSAAPSAPSRALVSSDGAGPWGTPSPSPSPAALHGFGPAFGSYEAGRALRS
jgi:hypothetical protein